MVTRPIQTLKYNIMFILKSQGGFKTNCADFWFHVAQSNLQL